MPAHAFADLNVVMLRSTCRTSLTSSLPPVPKETLRVLQASGYTTVALSRVVFGRPKKDSKCDFNPKRFTDELEALRKAGELPTAVLGPHRHGPAPLTVLSRLTLVAENPEDITEAISNEVLASYDIVAMQPTSQQTFQLACERATVDIVTLDCSQRLQFHVSRKNVQLAQGRGIRFELSYSPSLQDPSARRHLFAAARTLAPLVSGRAILLSSGASEAVHTRGPYDASNLGAILKLPQRPSAHDCVAGVPQLVVSGARERCMRRAGVVSVMPCEPTKQPEEGRSGSAAAKSAKKRKLG